ncbi:MAG TPA: hypothetical protein VD994_15810 [Prosthecobacter sp.]|nr:hypothetical protein [Prosthecobacter sp.]
MKPFPPEAHPFVLVTALMAVFFVAALIRVWLLRRQEEKLLKNKDALEKQIVAQQREVMAIRADSQQWRAEMKREFDGFRAMASDQLKVEEKRFDDLMKRSERRQADLQAALDIARQMCAELPAAKARVLHLEQALGIDGGEGLPPADGGEGGRGGGGGRPLMPSPSPSATEPRREWNLQAAGALPAIPTVEEDRVGELERNLASARQQNAALQQALTTERLRNRAKVRGGRSKVGK